MSDKIYYPEVIENYSIGSNVQEPNPPVYNASTPKSQNTQQVIVDAKFPVKRISEELISTSLDSKRKKILGAYSFGTMGALTIGIYENGVSGDVSISPDGVVARNVNGTTTFAIDGTTGNATFLGTIEAGAIVSGQVTVTGAFVVNDGTYNVIWLGYLAGGF